jgi:hypothetical protein
MDFSPDVHPFVFGHFGGLAAFDALEQQSLQLALIFVALRQQIERFLHYLRWGPILAARYFSGDKPLFVRT